MLKVGVFCVLHKRNPLLDLSDLTEMRLMKTKLQVHNYIHFDVRFNRKETVQVEFDL